MVFTCTFPCNPVFQFQRLFTRSRLQQHHSAPPLSNSNLKPSSSSSSSSHHYGHTFSLIQDSAVIACLRANSAEQAMEAARAAVNGGIAVLEIVRSTPDVFEVLQALANEYPTKAFGVGTVLTAEDAKTAIKAGAKFLMSPATVNDILDDVRDTDVLYMPGVMTPTEIYSAHNAGAKIVKIYPVSALGGVRYISAIRKPFSHIPMVASQGITIDSVGDYIAQGATSVVLSDAIFDKEAMNQNNFDVVNRLATSAALQGKFAVESAAFALACSKSYVRTYISSIFHFLKEGKIKHDRKGILTEQIGKAELFFPTPMSFMCPISEAQTFLLGSVQASDTCSTRNTILIW
ncbi:hypothetical protein CXB51_025218 [Gossypium anomalum]|uniref:KHG/KDPG aldolase n=1 Tax=Gossypium anomalum TaxID=47600 RepID=A0A8J5Z3Y5_9ROSI|nr:hypothetical protein CXB51_025218 [Gossypium anomalum]